MKEENKKYECPITRYKKGIVNVKQMIITPAQEEEKDNGRLKVYTVINKTK